MPLFIRTAALELPGDATGEGSHHDGLGLDEVIKILAAELAKRAVPAGHDGGGARCVGEQGQLAERRPKGLAGRQWDDYRKFR